jgi:phage portal protein BeeE
VGLLSKVFAASPEDPKTAFSVLMDIIGIGTGTDSGILVNERSALQNSVVLACVRVIAETLATLPLNVYQRLDRGKRRATDHRLYSMLHDEPNPQMSSVALREAETAQLLLWGNLYAEIQRDRAGRVIALWPLPSDRTRPVRKDGKLYYETALMSAADPVVYQITADFASSNQVRYIRPRTSFTFPD